MSPLVGALALFVAASVPSDRIQERARAVLDSSGYQSTIPDEPPDASWRLPLDPLAFILKALLVVALVVAAVLAATWLGRRLARPIEDPQAPTESPTDPAAAAFEMGVAEALAAAGRYAEAIHLLLLETLAALSTAARLAPSLTCREIVAQAPMPPKAREALAALAQAVEVSHFGGARPTETDYGACLERFHLFLATYQGAA